MVFRSRVESPPSSPCSPIVWLSAAGISWWAGRLSAGSGRDPGPRSPARGRQEKETCSPLDAGTEKRDQGVWILLASLLLVAGVIGPDSLGPGHGEYLPHRLILLGLAAVVPAFDIKLTNKWGRLTAACLGVALLLQTLILWDYALDSNRTAGQIIQARSLVGRGKRIATLLLEFAAVSAPIRCCTWITGSALGPATSSGTTTKPGITTSRSSSGRESTGQTRQTWSGWPSTTTPAMPRREPSYGNTSSLIMPEQSIPSWSGEITPLSARSPSKGSSRWPASGTCALTNAARVLNLQLRNRIEEFHAKTQRGRKDAKKRRELRCEAKSIQEFLSSSVSLRLCDISLRLCVKLPDFNAPVTTYAFFSFFSSKT